MEETVVENLNMSQIEVGKSGKIIKVLGEGRVRRRLFDMGVTPGVEITVKKLAPLGDPIEVLIRGYDLTLRKIEAECVVVEVE